MGNFSDYFGMIFLDVMYTIFFIVFLRDFVKEMMDYYHMAYSRKHVEAIGKVIKIQKIKDKKFYPVVEVEYQGKKLQLADESCTDKKYYGHIDNTISVLFNPSKYKDRCIVKRKDIKKFSWIVSLIISVICFLKVFVLTYNLLNGNVIETFERFKNLF